jgi:carbamoyltransferase
MTNDKFNNLFDGPPRKPESELTQKEMDLAASIQMVIEEVLIKLAKDIVRSTGQKNLCLAGGVALNCVANGKLLREGIFENIWIQPAAGDAGGAIGAALVAYYLHNKQPREVNGVLDAMSGSYLGPGYSQDEIEEQLIASGAIFKTVDDTELIKLTAQVLTDGKAVGWHQGRMEFGPRALGNRSILADPRSASTQKRLNLKVKHRESFRPFAPSILREDVSQWFDLAVGSPYMLLVAGVIKDKQFDVTKEQETLFGIERLNIHRSMIPAVTHVDYSARVQTVDEATNPRYYQLIKCFKELTGCPVLVNTSFNVRGEPIVESPEDAFKCFMGTDIDFLVIGNSVLNKTEQNQTMLMAGRSSLFLHNRG